jgi:hypothetical protein
MRDSITGRMTNATILRVALPEFEAPSGDGSGKWRTWHVVCNLELGQLKKLINQTGPHGVDWKCAEYLELEEMLQHPITAGRMWGWELVRRCGYTCRVWKQWKK